MESGVHSFPCSKCHHQFVFAKMNLKPEYLLPYEREHMNYNKAEKISLIRAINSIDWDDSFVEAKVSEFNKLLLNICRNYILNKSVL